MRRVVGLLVLATLGLVGPARAQYTTGDYWGKVKDATGAVVVGATVTVTNVATAQQRTTKTGGDGRYKFEELPPGSYTIRIGAPGFKTAEFRNYVLDAGVIAFVDATLAAGAPQEVVVVDRLSARRERVEGEPTQGVVGGVIGGVIGGMVGPLRALPLPPQAAPPPSNTEDRDRIDDARLPRSQEATASTFPITKVYHGSNASHWPCVIIDVDKVLSEAEIKDVVRDVYRALRFEDQSIVRLLLKHQGESYALVNAERDLGRIESHAHYFRTLREKYSVVIDRFLKQKESSPLRDHTIYGIYFSLGGCAILHPDHPTELRIITEDPAGGYSYSRYFTRIPDDPSRLVKGQGRFDLGAIIRFYETADGDLLVKDIEHVDEAAEKYIEYLHRLR
jgi:hypothetical protein